eukprot:CAMPEP_0183532568 /NCGR_PEP_ID=MMETSP0371-20130417/25609_1 /TAXON_ID=268820 /ORGANISM="Peridinium aciculiferum, Strain PAER-2" /LENGTH=64 /DNA_ID=CAMNT_0025732711 /DNA_START=161 /DNA_END=355 /DNA_ORIENTATION=-
MPLAVCVDPTSEKFSAQDFVTIECRFMFLWRSWLFALGPDSAVTARATPTTATNTPAMAMTCPA